MKKKNNQKNPQKKNPSTERTPQSAPQKKTTEIDK